MTPLGLAGVKGEVRSGVSVSQLLARDADRVPDPNMPAKVVEAVMASSPSFGGGVHMTLETVSSSPFFGEGVLGRCSLLDAEDEKEQWFKKRSISSSSSSENFDIRAASRPRRGGLRGTGRFCAGQGKGGMRVSVVFSGDIAQAGGLLTSRFLQERDAFAMPLSLGGASGVVPTWGAGEASSGVSSPCCCLAMA